ncbi:MAG: acetyl-CoA C-acyltransferase [Betaproteobacteria bacterium]|nr:MAG: acetyl-CoA C-acyltransferase [Betaproteobacteria bacterium]
MSRQVQDAYIVAAARSPVGKAPRGVFRHVRPDDLLGHVLNAAMVQVPAVERAEVDDVVVGCAMPEAEQGMNVARIGLLLAGFPNSVSGITVNRFCSSGLNAVAIAADRIRLGEADIMIGAGTESMSLIPMGGNKIVANERIFADNEHVGIAYGMGITAEKVAEQWKVPRDAQDAFAVESHRRALAAIESGEFETEIAPYTVRDRTADLDRREIVEQPNVVSVDEGPRPGTTAEVLAGLRPVFAAKGSVTAGNSSQTSDGAGAVILASETAIKRHNLQPMARFLGFAVAGVPPEIMGIGPKFAIPKVLKQTDIKLEDVDWIELNEAFAAQSLAVINDLGLNRERVNPLGGAIALGHPLGATGAIRTATLVHGMRRRKHRYGMVTMCIGTGMGAAGLFENVS